MRRACILLVTLVLVACGGDSTTQPTMASVAGTWNLQSVNGAALPYTISQSGSDSELLTGDVITATSSGSFTEITTYRVTQSGQTSTQTSSDAGSFSLNGTAVSFAFNSGSTGTGTLNGNTFTIAEGGVSFLYRKQ